VTYVEKTVSGTGLRILGLGGTKYINRKQKIPGSKVSIESYRYCPRYITVSGLMLDGAKQSMPDLGDIDAVITDFVAELDGINCARSNVYPGDNSNIATGRPTPPIVMVSTYSARSHYPTN
jgi:hypothetical protein